MNAGLLEELHACLTATSRSLRHEKPTKRLSAVTMLSISTPSAASSMWLRANISTEVKMDSTTARIICQDIMPGAIPLCLSASILKAIHRVAQIVHHAQIMQQLLWSVRRLRMKLESNKTEAAVTAKPATYRSKMQSKLCGLSGCSIPVLSGNTPEIRNRSTWTIRYELDRLVTSLSAWLRSASGSASRSVLRCTRQHRARRASEKRQRRSPWARTIGSRAVSGFATKNPYCCKVLPALMAAKAVTYVSRELWQCILETKSEWVGSERTCIATSRTSTIA
mmetsp:Transcript_107552/g.314463  ORF Transcript_107552/g.314463 Transcript_107552/m.314463 type:complete len:280 (+) Transcript_107552:369-1208(+)